MAQIMICGYESDVASSNNAQSMENLVTSLYSSLLVLVDGPKGKKSRPIVFTAHSLGGLMVKQVGPPFISIATKGPISLTVLGPYSTVEICR